MGKEGLRSSSACSRRSYIVPCARNSVCIYMSHLSRRPRSCFPKFRLSSHSSPCTPASHRFKTPACQSKSNQTRVIAIMSSISCGSYRRAPTETEAYDLPPYTKRPPPEWDYSPYSPKRANTLPPLWAERYSCQYFPRYDTYGRNFRSTSCRDSSPYSWEDERPIRTHRARRSTRNLYLHANASRFKEEQRQQQKHTWEGGCPDIIDRLDTSAGFCTYHHEGPYDAVNAGRNLNSMCSPIDAVRRDLEETLKAVPAEVIRDCVVNHRPLDGVAYFPPGHTDGTGHTYDYEEGTNMAGKLGKEPFCVPGPSLINGDDDEPARMEILDPSTDPRFQNPFSMLKRKVLASIRRRRLTRLRARRSTA